MRRIATQVSAGTRPARQGARPRRTRRPAHEAGYNLVFIIALFTLMSVVLTAALPELKKHVQREKEAELIFRGLQIAEAVRVFQQRYGRYPNALEELLEVEPRSIRQLWQDPMTKDGRWALILASGGNNGQGNQGDDEDENGRSPGQVETGGQDLAAGSAPQSSFKLGRSSFDVSQPRGPIVGVVSRAKGVASRVFLGKEQYSEWRFTANMLPKPAIVPGADIVARANVEWLGRPFPPGLKAQSGTGVDGLGADLAGGEAPTDLFERKEGQ